ncbi:SDR family oxidoreductase [Vibrio sp.]|uniref:Glucose 1-dehydrogenase n=1 Tax=Vibrio viridaestus TaxID=2487322 RepID=A0A3N9U1G1_9VIBR|nr:SDR family oxidoreductase [Vibrio viridaestus]MDC0609596.1 SDR family oxidoreductase [Vibrio sp.]RQW63312.1 glucose 1-dehydrogenase [Vibrio viridaestus]
MDSSLFSITGKTILITGASRGIGLALAKGVAGAGANVIIAGRSQKTLDVAQASIGDVAGSVSTLVVDVTSQSSIEQAFQKVASIDVLINNAGTEHVCPSLELTEEIWDTIIGTNLKGAFFCSQAAAKKMLPTGRGVIINLCSLTSEVGVPGAVPYGSSKSGVLGMTRALSTEWAPKGIRVNGIGPGYFQTEMTEVFYENKSWCQSMLEKIPQQRFGELEDLVGTAIFLASDASKYITGQVIYVDGGYLAAI